MKEIADWIDMAPSILSSPIYDRIAEVFRGHQELPAGRSAGLGARLVNNVSKKRLLSHIEEMILRP